MIPPDRGFAYFGTAAFTVRLLRLDQKIASGMPMSLKRVANILNTDAMLFQEFCDRLSEYGDKTVMPFAVGEGVEVTVLSRSRSILRAVAEPFRVPPLGKACKRLRRPTQKSRDAAAIINIAAKKQP